MLARVPPVLAKQRVQTSGKHREKPQDFHVRPSAACLGEAKGANERKAQGKAAGFSRACPSVANLGRRLSVFSVSRPVNSVSVSGNPVSRPVSAQRGRQIGGRTHEFSIQSSGRHKWLPLFFVTQESVAFPCLCSRLSLSLPCEDRMRLGQVPEKACFLRSCLSPFTIFAPSGWLSPWRIGRCDGALTD